jgi:hypothetical protein
MSALIHSVLQSKPLRVFSFLMVVTVTIVLATALVPGERPAQAGQTDGDIIVLWSSMGSGGMPDEQDLNAKEVVFSGPVASIRDTEASASVVLRYPLGTIPMTASNDLQVRVRYRDNGGDARVRVAVRQFNVNSGSTGNVLNFDSNDYPSENSYQVRDLVKCNYSANFETFIYFVEVTLDKTALNANPQIASIQIIEYVCR